LVITTRRTVTQGIVNKTILTNPNEFNMVIGFEDSQIVCVVYAKCGLAGVCGVNAAPINEGKISKYGSY
jgi:hypothetical protein